MLIISLIYNYNPKSDIHSPLLFCLIFTALEACGSDALDRTGDVDPSNWDMMEEDCIMDTVGVICVDSTGLVASGSSSGGIAMKVLNKCGICYFCFAKPS